MPEAVHVVIEAVHHVFEEPVDEATVVHFSTCMRHAATQEDDTICLDLVAECLLQDLFCIRA